MTFYGGEACGSGGGLHGRGQMMLVGVDGDKQVTRENKNMDR